VISENTIETHSGLFVDLLDPAPESIVVEDIAWALSRIGRYIGATNRFYSVAEHAVFVAKRLELNRASTEMVFVGLHHDSGEAYLGDIARPLKKLIGKSYRTLTDNVDAAIAKSLGVPEIDSAERELIHQADNWALTAEAYHLMTSRGQGWPEAAGGDYQPSADLDDWASLVLAGPAPEEGVAVKVFLSWHQRLSNSLQNDSR